MSKREVGMGLGMCVNTGLGPGWGLSGNGVGFGKIYIKNLRGWDGVGDKPCGSEWGWGSLDNR